VPDNTDQPAPATPENHPIRLTPSERTVRAPGGPPVSTLPEGTDSSAESLVVRDATRGDSALLLAWRNDPETRAWSRTTDPVSPADHEAWLARVLDDPDRRLLIVERDGRPVGTVRFDRDGEGWEVSITASPEARGRRLAVPMLLAAERVVGPAVIRACVHERNRPSLALFGRAGYRADGADGAWRWFAKEV
jgi:RimJ/RimL family protein N-acetyltransferase